MSKMAKRYFKAELIADSPLKISSGSDGITDSDILVDATGKPFIPGSTLCGVSRHYIKALHTETEVDGCAFEDYWFGYSKDSEDENAESRIRFFDAFPVDEVSISARDGVKLDEFKTAIDQGKYDYQVIDAGAKFLMRVDVTYDPENEAKDVNALLGEIASGIQSREIRVGGKTSRGFGELRIENAKVFDIDLNTQVDAYINFDWNRSAFTSFTFSESEGSVYEPAMRIPLAVASSLMIRDYGTQAKSGHEEKLVDAETLKNAVGDPVVPGTSWAGAFRHHMLKILKAAEYDKENNSGDTAEHFLNRMFGGIEGERATASKIVFSESVINGAVQLNSTRNAIDRFTGGAADQKLFTNRLSYGGTTKLVIRWRKDIDEADKRLLESLVDVCVDDLLDGTLAVGGMTATGSGIFKKDEKREAEGAAR